MERFCIDHLQAVAMHQSPSAACKHGSCEWEWIISHPGLTEDVMHLGQRRLTMRTCLGPLHLR